MLIKTNCDIVSPNGLYTYVAPIMLVQKDFILALAQEKDGTVIDFMTVSGIYEDGLHGLLKYGLSYQGWSQITDENGELVDTEYFVVNP